MADSTAIHFTVPGLADRLRREVDRLYPLPNYPVDWPSPEARFANLVRLAADELDRLAIVVSGRSGAS